MHHSWDHAVHNNNIQSPRCCQHIRSSEIPVEIIHILQFNSQFSRSCNISSVISRNVQKIPSVYSNNGDNSLAQKRTRHATNLLFSVHFDKYSEIRAGVPTSKNMTASLWQGSSELVFNAKQRFKSRDGYSTKWARCVAKQPLMPAAVTSSDTQSSLLPNSASVSSLLEAGHSQSPSKSITFPGSSRYAIITTYIQCIYAS